MITNRKVVLKARPDGRPKASDFAVETEQVGEPGQGMALIEVSHLSIDAFIRTTLSDGGIHSTVPLGGTCIALGVGKVLASACPELRPGDWVSGPTLAQTHAVMPGAMFQKIDTAIAPPSAYLGVLGLTTGLTAYFGLLEVIRVKAGDVVVVSGAAGAVGSVACQLAKIHGATVIGIAGGPAKVRYLTDTIGADHGIDYKSEDVGARLTELAPGGIDVFFDNVGGELLDTVLDRLASNARISICGAISQYDHLDDVRGPKLYLRLAERNSTMCGFTVDHFSSRFGEAIPRLVRWMAEGKIRLPEHVEKGIERYPAALDRLFTGGHMGKLLVTP
jgi:NADPH-dependent curcumin reductase CurA